MKKMISLTLAFSFLLLILPCMPVTAGTEPPGAAGAEFASYDELVEFTEPFSGELTIGNTVKSIKITYSDSITDEMIANTTGACVIVEGGRTEALELTIENFRIKAPDGEAGIDFGSAGNFEHKLYIEGNCSAEGSGGKAGIHVPAEATVTVDKAPGLSEDAGAGLTAKGGDFAAGIGGNSGESGGNINVSGGTVTVSGGIYAAGIGGGWTGAGGTINIIGGTVITNGSYGGAGIGGGRESYANLPGEGDGGTINISGGTVTATTGGPGAAIGGGWGGSAGIISISGGTVNATGFGAAAIGNGFAGTGGTINISGGTVTAVRGNGAAGIGGGGSGTVGSINITGGDVTVPADGDWAGAGIGGGGAEAGGTINIGGGNVNVFGGTYAAGIGGGSGGSSGNISICGGTVTATAGVQGAGIGGGVGGRGENISISDGEVTAYSAFGGAGIGGGNLDTEQTVGNDGGNITISGGTVTAICKSNGAGIGGGLNGNGGNIVINGGNITATSGDGSWDNKDGAGIGGGDGGNGGTITINAGTVIAKGAMFGAGIGGGYNGTGGTITINNGTVNALGGSGGAAIGGGSGGSGGTIGIGGGTIEATGGYGGAGIGGGSNRAGGTIGIDGGTIEATGGSNAAGIGGGSNGVGGTIGIGGGTVEATGGDSAAGIGGGTGKAGGTVDISGGAVTATGGNSAAGIGGGMDGSGANVTISNNPAITAIGDVVELDEFAAQHIGHGAWGESDSGTLKNDAGVNMSYFRVTTTNTSGSALQGIKVSIKGSDTEGYTDSNGSYQALFTYTDASYEITFSKPGYASVRRKGIYSTSHDIRTVMLTDNTPPKLRFNALDRMKGEVSCNDFGEYGTIYFVPKGETNYSSKAALDQVTGGSIKIELEQPSTKAQINASSLKSGFWQIYVVDSAENVSRPLNVKLPFEIHGTVNSGAQGADLNDAAFIEKTIPVSSLSGMAGKPQIIRTDLASLILPSNMLTAEMAGNAKSAVISIEKADVGKLPTEVRKLIGSRPVLEFSLKLDGKLVYWNNSDAPVTVSIPYKPTPEELKDPEHITVWYIDGKGNVISIPDGRYNPDTGEVTFSVTHFSCFAVTYVRKTFSDIDKYKWAKNQIEILASKGIADGTGKDTFSPGTDITRADFLVMLVRTLGLSASFDTNFVDIKSGTDYYKEIGIAKKLGLTDGDGNNRFNPSSRITRQDMMVLTTRALKMLKLAQTAEPSVLEGFSDRNEISEYAAESMAIMVKERFIEGSGDRINPRGAATRAEAAVFLYRIYSKKYN